MRKIKKGKGDEMNQLKILQKNNQDYEWYPTTDEIIDAVRYDMIKLSKSDKFKYRHQNTGIYFNDCSHRDDESSYADFESFLDIGAGDGRVFDRLTKKEAREHVKIDSRYGIEKATLQGDNLIKSGVALIGRDFYETVLIDRKFTVVFSNPPYSQFKEWCVKLVKEVNARVIYLVIPKRWQLDSSFKQILNDKGAVEVIGSFDFTEADRAARAKVDVIRITPDAKNDTFRAWIEEHIGSFESNEPIDLQESDEWENPDKWYYLKEHNDNTVAVMVENYKEDLQKLMLTFKSLGSIDWSIISQLGVSKDDVMGKIRADIKGLKNRYWRLVINNLDEITSRLTLDTRESLLKEITWFKELDFNENNIRTIALWVIENFNKYTKKQMLDVYDKLTNFETVRAYKSNDKWIDDGWRYSKKVPVKYSLDYRIVVTMYGIFKYRSEFSCQINWGNPIANLAIVARSLGFDNYGIQTDERAYETGKKHYCYKKDSSVLFEYKVHKNDNVHFKLDKGLLRVLNVEVGKERGWLKKPKDIQEEFDVSEVEAVKYFKTASLSLLQTSDLLMLTHEGS
jgi:hypothetical protein